MAASEVFVREAGSGPGVVCLHSNASSSSQWRGLMDSLSRRHRVLAPDAYGAGKSPGWPMDRPLTLADEAEFIEPVLQRAGSPLVLVGHSYGAAVALIAALRQPARVKALVLYEPTLFSLIEAESPQPNAADGIRHAVAAAAAALDRGDTNGAAEHFIDYWMGTGSWAAMPESRQLPIAASVRNVRHWTQALFTEPTPLAAFRSLELPVLYMVGDRSTASAHGVARLLVPALPRVTPHRFDTLGHMGPVTDPEPVNRVIEDFLARL